MNKKMILLCLLALSQILFASDKIILKNDIEYECQFIRFFETDNGEYVEIQIEDNVSSIPLDQIEAVISEAGTLIFQDGEIRQEEIEIENATSVKRPKVKQIRAFPDEAQGAFPAGIYITPVITETQGTSTIIPQLGFMINRPYSRSFIGTSISYTDFEGLTYITPSLLIGIKSGQRMNYFCQGSISRFTGKYSDIDPVYSLSFGMSLSQKITQDALYSMKFGVGEAMSKDNYATSLLFVNEFILPLIEDVVSINPGVEFGLDLKNEFVTTALGISIIL